MSSADLERFYELLRVVEALPGQGRRLAEYTGRSDWPRRGVYFFREPGEARAGGQDVNRIVRVGTHAVGTGRNSRLWGRLRAHRGARDGRGNHRGSVFRLHVGAALLAKEGRDLETWGRGSTGTPEGRASEAEHERRVSDYIGAMTVLWVAVPDEPGPTSLRATIERNSIALLSNAMRPHDPPSAEWLGHHSLKTEIRQTGLWNVNHVAENYAPAFLSDLEAMVREMSVQLPRE